MPSSGRLRVPLATAVLAGVEAVVVAATGVPALPLAPQVGAVPPFGLFHDLRWLLVFHSSWWGFLAELGALAVFRSVVVAGLVALSWPDDVRRPDIRQLLRRAAGHVSVATLVLIVPALLVFTMAVASLSWPLFAAVPMVVAAAVLVHHAPVTGGWSRRLPSRRSCAWVGAQLVVVMLASATIDLSPGFLGIPLATGFGAVNGVIWLRFVHELATATHVTRRVRVAPLVLVGFYAAVVAGLALFVGYGPGSRSTPPQTATPTNFDGRRVVLVAPGFGSSWDGDSVVDLGPGLQAVHFSYRGVGADGMPLPYGADATQQSIGDLADIMAAEVDALHRRTGGPVTIVASSEASVVTQTYLEQTAHPPVDDVLLLSPLVQPARVYYPPDGGPGWGVASGWMLEGLGRVISAASHWQLDPDMPMLRSILDHADALRSGMLCPVDGVRIRALVPLAGEAAIPVTARADVPVEVVPGFHGAALAPGEIGGVLHQRLVDGSASASALFGGGGRFVRAAAAAWQVPELPMSLNPAWSAPEHGSRCASAAAAFRRWGDRPGE